ncbi:MAG: hypothetical protein DHS80DRAFT_21526 [Piptocephalis tieghemiana]|nr:MAG: hypothetical protein DHS80DRAFT_21526 [Piptocephalis tieghemiana]
MDSASDQTPLLPHHPTPRNPQTTEEPAQPSQTRQLHHATPSFNLSRLAIPALWTILIAGSALFAHYILSRFLLRPPSDWHNRITDFSKYWYGLWSIGIHFVAGFIITVIGPLQISNRIRRWKPIIHRWSGRLYLVSSVIVSIAGMTYVVTSRTVGGINMDICFFTFGACFLYCSIRTWKTIRVKQYALHREWAIRTFTLGIGSLLYRFYVFPVKMHEHFGLSWEAQYLWLNLAGWFMFLPNIVIVEPYLWWTRKA